MERLPGETFAEFYKRKDRRDTITAFWMTAACTVVVLATLAVIFA